MRVLPAVFADARDITLDVARLEDPRIERRGEQADQLSGRVDQPLVHGSHRLSATIDVAGARDDRPRLRQAVDLALGVFVRAEWRAVIEIRAAIPLPDPGMG